MEGWIIQIGLALLSAAAIYGAFRTRVARLEVDLRGHIEASGLKKRDLDRKLDAQFKRVDTCTERVTILERDTSTHLDMIKAEEKFVSKKELELHLKNIELMTTNTNQKVEKIEGKLEDLIEVLTSGTVKIGRNHE